ncbi:MAG: hypothetical protein HC895_15965 [Leptolyngbyaceae cyanobacterium SM1_3_5]|nr:hypothetical protein [Leptolyngbyaceae cyanobacterium SM1_3_5]
MTFQPARTFQPADYQRSIASAAILLAGAEHRRRTAKPARAGAFWRWRRSQPQSGSNQNGRGQQGEPLEPTGVAHPLKKFDNAKKDDNGSKPNFHEAFLERSTSNNIGY